MSFFLVKKQGLGGDLGYSGRCSNWTSTGHAALALWHLDSHLSAIICHLLCLLFLKLSPLLTCWLWKNDNRWASGAYNCATTYFLFPPGNHSTAPPPVDNAIVATSLPTLPKPSLASPLPVLDVCAMAHGPCLARPKALLAHLLHCCPCLLFLAHVPWRCYVHLAP
jgi:hypothetical protein